MQWRVSGGSMIYVDIESFSELDIREVGVYRYWEHPSTRILIICWAVNDEPVQTWTWLDGVPPPEFTGVPRLTLCAHNAAFERLAFRRYNLSRYVRWHDTAAQAAQCALPRALGRVADALGLETRKDKRGSYLISKLSKPQRPSKTNPHTEPHLRWPDYKLLLNEFADYCATDVEVCRAVHKALPPLPPQEQAIYALTETINDRGVAVDLAAVHAAAAFVERVTGNRGAIVKSITGFTHTQVGELLNWVNERVDSPLESLDKAAVSAALRRKHLPADVREVLEIRRELAKSSTAKLDSIIARANEDGRVRGSLMYHGAATGRWAGSGIQPQNFPKVPKGHDLDDCVDAIHSGDTDWVRMVWGQDVPEFVSKSLRGMLITAPGHTLVGADFSSIEARVVLWLAKDPGVELFASGADIYVEMARSIQSDNRDLGKAIILGAGFGMGPPKFQATCEAKGLSVDLPLSEKSIQGYRNRFPKVPRLWRALEEAAVLAVKNPGKAYRLSDDFQSVQFVYDDKRFLKCRLPSGRFLYYAFPQTEPGKYGNDQMTFMGVDATTKAWRREHTYGGKITENVVQAIARDLMALALLRLEAAGYPVVMTVHDEAVCEVVEELFEPVERVEELMCKLPEWAPDLPVAAEGWSGRRYGK
jgi:DNA polymerase bacteriophage-type